MDFVKLRWKCSLVYLDRSVPSEGLERGGGADGLACRQIKWNRKRLQKQRKFEKVYQPGYSFCQGKSDFGAGSLYFAQTSSTPSITPISAIRAQTSTLVSLEGSQSAARPSAHHPIRSENFVPIAHKVYPSTGRRDADAPRRFFEQPIGFRT